MKSYADIRRAASRILTRKWGFRILFVGVACVVPTWAFGKIWQQACQTYGIETWGGFLRSWIEATGSGLVYSVPSRAVLYRLIGAEAFEQFFRHLFSGILSFALAVVSLRAVRKNVAGWFAASLGGVRNPFGVFWLAFRISLQVMLWATLFIVPGFIAYYRYSQAWFLQAEHPEWGAGRCLSESARLMRGRKAWLFGFDCSCWLPFTVVLVLLVVSSVIIQVGASLCGGVGCLVLMAAGFLQFVAFVLLLVVALWLRIGRAVAFAEITAVASADGGQTS